MLTLDVFILQENILLYRKLLADPKISDGERDVIGKLLAEEEAKLQQGQAKKTSLQPEDPA